MAKVLSDRDAAALEAMLRWWKANTDVRYQRRRHKANAAGGAGSKVRKAFVRAAVESGTTLLCYLDEDDAESEEISVVCHIYHGDDLLEAHPSFAVGDPLWVIQDAVSEVWENVTTISGVEDCEV